MKAEHRKELQTNVLADRMGRLLQRAKGRPKRSTVLTAFLVVLAILAVTFYFMTRRGRENLNSRLWAEFETGQLASLADLQKKYPTKEPGKAARFQLAWFQLWE